MQTIVKDKCLLGPMLMTLAMSGEETLDLLYLMESKTLLDVTSLNDGRSGGLLKAANPSARSTDLFSVQSFKTKLNDATRALMAVEGRLMCSTRQICHGTEIERTHEPVQHGLCH